MTKNNSQKTILINRHGFIVPIIIAIVAAVLVLGGVIYYANRPQQQENKAVQEKATMEKEVIATEEGFELKDGKMIMVNEKTKATSTMEKDATLNDGTKVMTSGKVVRKDGVTVMLKEGESVWMDGTITKAGEMMKEDEGSMLNKRDIMMKYSGEMLAGKSAPLLDFNKADYDAAVKSDKLVVLYFYANWCPICKAEFPVMQSVFNELKTDKAIGFRVNYNDDQTDNDEKSLARQFGVAYQHTKVFVKNGQRILKSPEGWDETRYDMEISKVLH